MGEQEKKVVWVLGSGFSKSLGGPLLEELFDPHRWRYVRSMISRQTGIKGDLITGFADQTPALARLGRLHDLYVEVKARSLRAPWRNAEEYIEMWESARDKDSPEHERCLDLLESLIEDVYDDNVQRAHALNVDLHSRSNQGDARTYLAAITSEFVHQSHIGGERWNPYLRWINQLDLANDHIVTFNYDLVVEKAFTKAKDVPIARTRSWPRAHTAEEPPGRLHKLHGSVDWQVNERKEIDVKEVDLVAMMQDGCKMALGIPGPGKFSASAKLFRPQWYAAETAIKEADVIVFVGYSFPSTDNYAKAALLNAIRCNRKRTLKVRIVLGPERSDPVRRLEGMLLWAFAGVRLPTDAVPGRHPPPDGWKWQDIRQEPMFAEDYLSVFQRKELVKELD
jgi:hypothetical protein